VRIAKFFHLRLRNKHVKFFLFSQVFKALLLLPDTGLGETIFYGVGNDGYFTDVIGIETALSGSIGTGTFSSYTYSDLTGSEIYNSTAALKTVLAPGDTLLWYYSGHGYFFPDDSLGDETQTGSFAFDSYDEAIGLQGDGDWLSDDKLAEAFSSLAGTNSGILAIVDMCYAGGLVGGTTDLNTVPGLSFFGSSSELELSYFISSDSYSLFTDSLINGLSNWAADSDNDGTIWASEWFQYSYDATVDSLAWQHPVFHGEDMMIALQTPTPVPLPGTVYLLGTGILSLLMRKKFGSKN
jgi:hypothetical protein